MSNSFSFVKKIFLLKTGQTFSIQEARGIDAKKILQFVHKVAGESTFLGFGPGEFSMTEEQEFDFLEKSFSSPSQLYLAGWIDEEVVGTLNFSGGTRKKIQHVAEFGLSVAQEHWNQGIGSHLLQSALEWCIAKSCIRKMNLRVREDNLRAIRLYEKAGFQVEGKQTKEMNVHGVYYDNYIMGKWLGLE